MTKYARLGDICLIKSAKRIFESEYVEEGIPFIRGQEISDGSVGKTDTQYECKISVERYNELKQTYGVPRYGDILITAVGTIGNLYFVNTDTPFYYKDGNIILFTDFSSCVYSKYLFYVMKSTFFKKQIEYSLIGAVQKALTMVMLSEIKIPLPPLDEQIKIAAVLSTIDDKISTNAVVVTELEAMAKTLYDYWFVQFDFPDENSKPYRTSGGKMVWNEQLKREIPKGWEVTNIGNLTTVVTGKEDANFSSPHGKYKFFTCSQEPLLCDTPAFSGQAVLIAGNGDFNVKHYSGEFNAYQRTYVLVPENRIYYGAMYISAKNQLQTFKNGSNGSIVKFITKGDVENIPFILPNDDLIFHQINKLIEKIELCERENEELTKLRDWLLPMLINGQARVE